MSLFRIYRKVAVRAQAGALLMCLLFGALHGVVLVALDAPDCCVNKICPLHRAHKHDNAMADCDHENGKTGSDCAMKCGMPKLDLAGVLPALPEMIFPASFAAQHPTVERLEVSAVTVAVPKSLFSPPEQPPRS